MKFKSLALLNLKTYPCFPVQKKKEEKRMRPEGLEPPTARSGVERATNCAIAPTCLLGSEGTLTSHGCPSPTSAVLGILMCPLRRKVCRSLLFTPYCL